LTLASVVPSVFANVLAIYTCYYCGLFSTRR